MYSLLDVPDKYWQGSYFYLPRTNAIKVRMDTGVQQPKVMQNALYISGQFSGKKLLTYSTFSLNIHVYSVIIDVQWKLILLPSEN